MNATSWTAPGEGETLAMLLASLPDLLLTAREIQAEAHLTDLIVGLPDSDIPGRTNLSLAPDVPLTAEDLERIAHVEAEGKEKKNG